VIPDFQTIMLPLLESLKEGDERNLMQTHYVMAEYFELTDEELNKHLPNGDHTLFYSRLVEAKSHLQMADLLENVNKGLFKITPLGKQVLHKRPNLIDTNYLRRFPGYIEAASR
jgi:restriction system protein